MEELWIVIGVIGILLLIALFCYLQNNAISHTRINIKTNKLKMGSELFTSQTFTVKYSAETGFLER